MNRRDMNRREMIGIAFQLGFIIALPVIFFGYIGKWLDGRWGTYPWITLVGILLAIVMTSVWIYRKFREYFSSK